MANSWVDPREASSPEDLFYRYTIAWGVSQAADEVIGLVDQFIEQARVLEEKERGESKNFKIGE